MSTMRPCLGGLLGWAVLLGVGCQGLPWQTSASGWVATEDLNHQGRLVVVRVENPPQMHMPNETYALRAPYGIATFWAYGLRRFYIFDQSDRRYFVTEDFEEFLDQLRTLPEGIELQVVDQCTVSASRDMPPQQRQRLVRTLIPICGASEQDTFEHFPLIFCTCVARSAVLIDDWDYLQARRSRAR